MPVWNKRTIEAEQSFTMMTKVNSWVKIIDGLELWTHNERNVKITHSEDETPLLEEGKVRREGNMGLLHMS